MNRSEYRLPSASAATRDIFFSRKAVFVSRLIKWGQCHRRNFPWRKTKNAYKLLVAEMMLRKTTAQQVEDVYSQFIKKFPNANALAKAHQKEVLDMITPLGMEKQRSRLLVKFAVDLSAIHGGSPPVERDKLLALPGVGEYAADAVLSLIYGKRVPMVDRGVLRVVSRFFAFPLPTNSRAGSRQVRSFLLPLLKRVSSRDFNLSLLDFAATVCRARHPLCPTCNLCDLCDYAPKCHISFPELHYFQGNKKD
jgi:A/G-specific adenine glycosylase